MIARLTGLLKKQVSDGRSTIGVPQPKDVAVATANRSGKVKPKRRKRSIP